MEASAIHAPTGLSRISISLPLLRLRSDEQLVALFRDGSDEAFTVLHDRYRQRLFAYVRQMLSAASRQDAEDVLQDVFVRAYGALRADRRKLNLRAWLYRVAHNRCIDHLRRPVPPAAEIFEVSRKPLHDPMEEAQRRDDLKRLVNDVARLPEQQRSALLMREIDGMSYADLAGALDVTVPAVKSLLVRARVGLVEAAEARDTDCAVIRDDLLEAYDRGVKASGRARKHMRECHGCREYRQSLRGMRHSFAALSPAAAGPIAVAAKLLGIGGAGGGAAAGGATAAGGGLVAGGAGAATACKVAAVVCTAAITAGGAVEVQRLTDHRNGSPKRTQSAAVAPVRSAPAPAAAATTGQTVPQQTAAARAPAPGARSAKASAATKRHERTRHEAKRKKADVKPERGVVQAPTARVQEPETTAPTLPQAPATVPDSATGGARAPVESPADTEPAGPQTATGPTQQSPGSGTTSPTPQAETGTPAPTPAPTETAPPPASGGATPPPEH